MSIRPIRIIGDPVLEDACTPVTRFDDDLKALIQDLKDTLYAAPGVGLAANQIGVSKHVAVVDLTVGEKEGGFIVLVNPRITAQEGTQEEEEGCLSIPEVTEKVLRPMKVTVEAQDADGNPQVLEGEGFLARAFSHEIDHLNGSFFIDRLKGIKKALAFRKVKKLQKAG
jgi:peptide deformylase